MSAKFQERRLLPTGIQTFSRLRNKECYYVDKTPLIREMIRQGRCYFLSRPRRFGKSLLFSTPEQVEKNVLNQLREIESTFDLKSLPPVTEAPDRLRNILTRLHQKAGQQVVVLVDEYDRPVLNVLEDSEKAKANRDILRDIYSILKDSEEHIRFVKHALDNNKPKPRQ